MRLPRPYIPLDVRLRVVLRQLGEMWISEVVAEAAKKGELGKMLKAALARLAELLCCPVNILQLDHHPALSNRQKLYHDGVHVGYSPPANDPAFMLYREKRAHHIKTNVRGDGAQYPDRVLLKRERRRAEKKFKAKWPKRKLRSRSRWPKGRRFKYGGSRGTSPGSTRPR